MTPPTSCLVCGRGAKFKLAWHALPSGRVAALCADCSADEFRLKEAERRTP